MARKVVTRSPHREVGIVNAGWLLDHPVGHESRLERRFVIAALSCPVVQDIVQKPIRIALEDLGAHQNKRIYTPTFKVDLRDGASIIIEVKPRSFVREHAGLLDAVERELRNGGLRFLVLTEVAIDGKALSTRAMLLMRYGRLRFADADAHQCLEALRSACKEDIAVKVLVQQGLPEALIWNLVARHECRVPADFAVDEHQVVTTKPFQGNNHDYFLSWFGLAHR
jgi:hypothetical protein